MKLLLVSVVLLVGGCGDDGGSDNPCEAGTCDPPMDARIDAPVDAPGVCNPLAPPGQQGCTGGQKCTWVVLEDTPAITGTLDCVPDGTIDAGGACTNGAAGATTGYDDCKAGNVCINSKCVDICGAGANASAANAACGQGYACVTHAGLFANASEDPSYGACAFRCNPLTQQLEGGGICPADQGCYTITNLTGTESACAAAGSTLTHGMLITGTVYANSCAPGHAPRLRYQTGNQERECGALCMPAEVTMTTNMTSEGGVIPYTCAHKGAELPFDPYNGESCRYFWSREPFAGLSPFSNTIGWCFKHATWQYDSDNDMILDAKFPRCPNLTHGDVLPPVNTPPDDALYFWCAPKPAPAMPSLVQEDPTKPKHFTGWRR